MPNSIFSDLELVITLRLTNQKAIWPFYNGAIFYGAMLLNYKPLRSLLTVLLPCCLSVLYCLLHFSAHVSLINVSLVSYRMLCSLLCSEVKKNLYKMESFNEIDDLELIKLVEVNSCLYNKTLREFKTTNKKDIWDQIGAALTNKKAGDQAQRRWDSLRAMWSRQHKKYYEQRQSGSGANQDTQEFQYYGDMSFLIPHYHSRQTKSNMKRPTFNNESSESQESQFIYKLSPKTVESTIISSDTDFDSQIENECSYEYLLLDSDELPQQPTQEIVSQQSSQQKKKHKFDTADRVPFSPIAQAALNKVSAKQSIRNETSTEQKYKLKENSNKRVPEPDEFYKKKKLDINSYMRLGAQSLEKVAQSVGDIISQKAAEKVLVSDSIDNIDKDISDMLKCAYVGLKQVRSDMRFDCIVDILKVINTYKQQGLQNND